MYHLLYKSNDLHTFYQCDSCDRSFLAMFMYGPPLVYLLYFLISCKTSLTSSGDPRKMGLLWWILSGTMSKMGVAPLDASPSA